jgi:hypothetical protein
MPDEMKNQRDDAAQSRGARNEIPQLREAEENDQHGGNGGKRSPDAASHRYFRDVDLWILCLVFHNFHLAHAYQVLLMNDSPTPAAAIAMVKITKLLTKVTKTLSVVMGDSLLVLG